MHAILYKSLCTGHPLNWIQSERFEIKVLHINTCNVIHQK